MANRLEAAGLALRRASRDDIDFLVGLMTHSDVEPFLGLVGARDRKALLEQIERCEASPEERGRLVVEAEADCSVRSAGTLGYEIVNRPSRIAGVSGVVVHPELQGRGLGVAAVRLLCEHLVGDLGYHRVQLECYEYNARAIQVFERAGFSREGVRRSAYWRHGRWNDGVLLGLVAEDLQAPDQPRVARRRAS